MTLEEAIKHCEEKMKELGERCYECSKEHEQLAEWLKELKAYKETPQGDLISREALRKDFKERLAKCDKWIEKAKDKETRIRASAVKAFIAEVIMTIDNAPTVYITTSNIPNCGGQIAPDVLQGWRYEENKKGGAE